MSDKPSQGKVPVNSKPKTKQRCFNCGSQEHFVRACPIRNNKTKQTQRRQGEIRCWTCNGPYLRRDCPRAQQRFIPHRWNSFSSTGGKTENNYRYNSNNRRVRFGNSTQTIEPVGIITTDGIWHNSFLYVNHPPQAHGTKLRVRDFPSHHGQADINP